MAHRVQQASLAHPKPCGHGQFAKVVLFPFKLILFHPYGSQRANFKVKLPQSLLSVFTCLILPVKACISKADNNLSTRELWYSSVMLCVSKLANTLLSFLAPSGNRTSVPQRLSDAQEIPLKILPLHPGTWSLYWNARHRERDEDKTNLAVISLSSKSAGFPLAFLIKRLEHTELLSCSFIWELLKKQLRY